MIGRTLTHYRVVEAIGAGAMGAVYRAHDERLDRDVALKLLPRERERDEAARARLLHEARALSRLQHPGIATVFDFDADGGIEFLVMELVPGVTLERKLGEGPFPEQEVIAIAMQAAEALAAAHREGVVHRDLKPANLKLTPEGRLKILDFGVAVLAEPLLEHAETATRAGDSGAVGTLAYMAPEQLLGEPVDARTDLYGLGVTLYELATGVRPFRAALAPALIDAILHHDPPDPRELRSGLSAGLAGAILRCLAKRPEQRYRAAAEFLEEVRAIPSRDAGTPRRPLHSVAVLPLENLSRDPDEEYFADGMTEALIAGLARVRGLRVISRTSVMRYKQDRPHVAAIARALHVDAIVEGSVMRSGDRVRITANLIDAAMDRNLWSDTYDRDLGDFFALQSEVSAAIAREIQFRLSPEDGERESPARRAVDPDAVRAYLKGRFHWEKRSEEGIYRAIELFNEAIERDPLYALAHVGLADSYIVLASFSLRASRDSAMRARAAARRALEIDDSLAEAYTSLAAIADSHEWNRPEAERLYLRAIELTPNYATAHHWYSDYLTSMGRFDEALAEVRRAEDLDPLSLIISTSVGSVLYYSRRYQESVDYMLGLIDLGPGFPATWRALGGSLEMLGRYGEAIAAFERTRELSGNSTYSILALAHAHALSGNREKAREFVAALRREAWPRYVSPYSLAAVHTALGEIDDAFESLDRALAERDRALVWLPVSPRLEPLRSDPRFHRFVQEVRGGD